MHAEALYTNAKVVTVDPDFTIADAFAVSGDSIVAVGSGAELDALAGPDTRMVDLGGRTVLPGFLDAHAHSVYRGLVDAARPALAGATSVAQLAARVAAAVADAAPGAWIVTSPLGEPPDFFDLPGKYAEGRWPDRADLDAVAPDNPVYIPTSAYWPHPAVLNSAALALLGVDRDTPDGHGVRIDRDAAGVPTGVLHGLIFYNAHSPLFGRLMSLLPATPETDTRDAIARALAENVSAGITGVYEGHGNVNTADLRALHAAGRLACRVVLTHEVPASRPGIDVAAWMSGCTEAAGQGSGDDLLRVRGVTVSLDGPPHFGLALMRQPYRDPQGARTNGRCALSTTDLAEVARLAVRHDLRLNVVAAGDGGCALAVDALAEVHRETPLTGRNWVAQHFHHATREQIARLAAMGLCTQSCAGVDYARGVQVYVDRLPGAEWRRVTPLRWWLDAGVPVGLASDGAHHDPLFQLWAALSRVDARSGRSLLTPEKTVTRAEAVRAATAGAATVLGMPERIGSIEAGKLADFVVLDTDILTCPVDAVRQARVLRTVLGGQTVHER